MASAPAPDHRRRRPKRLWLVAHADPGQHRTIFYGEYSSRARAGCQPLEPDATSSTADHPPPRRLCPPSWARLIAKVYQVDPLVCTRCGQRMSILAFVSDQHSISRILEHLGLRSPELDRPPPAREIREITRVAEAGEGWIWIPRATCGRSSAWATSRAPWTWRCACRAAAAGSGARFRAIGCTRSEIARTSTRLDVRSGPADELIAATSVVHNVAPRHA